MKHKTNNKFAFALASVLLTSATTLFAKTTEPINLTLNDYVSTEHRLLDTNGKKVSLDVLKGKYIGVYFSAKWCGPCRAFTPKLQEFRDANNEEFEVVFISMDVDHANRSPSTNLAKKNEYIKSAKMNWYTVDCGYDKSYLAYKKCGKRGIPTLVVFSPDGKYVTNAGRNDLKKSSATALGSWKILDKLNRK